MQKKSSTGGSARETHLTSIEKAATGISGFDDITSGGLPRGRTSLVCGGAGCGKTLFSMEFLVRGAIQYDEPGVFLAFEETPEELAKNVASLGFDLDELARRGKLYVDHVRVERGEIEESGDYDLEGLFIRLQLAIEAVGAKRIVLDTVEAIFGGFSNQAILRSELRRLLRWLKDRGLTTVITGERGESALTRHGLEEYVSDCVVLLDHRVENQISTRSLRVVKYRGSVHGTNEYPFLIDEDGLSVLPVSSIGLDHRVSNERISSGVPELDEMLGGAGYYRGSSILVSGTAGIGKSSLAAHFVEAVCGRGERCLYVAFEESPQQILRNMRSINLDLEPAVRSGLLQIQSSRPTLYGLEMHLVRIHKLVREFQPSAVVIDPITSLITIGSEREFASMLVRLVDYLKSGGITALFSNLISGGQSTIETSETGITSLIDTWILLRAIEIGGERNRGIYVIKSRGMAHSNQIREFLLSSGGIRLIEAYLGPNGVVTGSARLAVEAQERVDDIRRQQVSERRRLQLERRRKALEAQIALLQAELLGEEQELQTARDEESGRQSAIDDEKSRMARSRAIGGRISTKESVRKGKA